MPQFAPTPTITDRLDYITATAGFGLFSNIKWHGRPYFQLHADWDFKDKPRPDLPPGYDYYIISHHVEHIHFEWLRRQTVGPIIVLSDFKTYQDHEIPGVTFYRWIYWHHALDKMMKWFGTTYNKDIKYKASAFCNRITQSKIIATTALLENFDKEDYLVALNTWLDLESVHNWQPTGNKVLDQLTNIFREKYYGQKWTIDDFNSATQNQQSYTANPAHPAYQQAAIHLTNESFHYSLMQEGKKKFIVPGPHLSEKTFKCLLGGTAFIPVGQFETYSALEELGMQFNYGLDLSFDQDPGNISRMTKMVDLIKTVNNYSKEELYTMTQDSSEFNQNLVTSGQFFNNCETVNLNTLAQLQKIV